ncbi:MAG: hypothetical protein IJ779_00280 [Ruminococcus sp.]|nr:hypothetical protein [Ruminococcus sp.]
MVGMNFSAALTGGFSSIGYRFIIEMLLVGVVLVLLVKLFRDLFKLLKFDPKGIFGAFLAVMGVIAVITVPMFFIGEERWSNIVYLAIIGVPVVSFAVAHPKRMLKLVLITAAGFAAVLAISLKFGFGAAAVTALNLVCASLWIFNLRRAILFSRLEKNGAYSEGKLVSCLNGRGQEYIRAYYNVGGNEYSEICDFSPLRKDNSGTVNIFYDEKDPSVCCVEKYSRIRSTVWFCVFFALHMAVLGFTVYLAFI